MDNLTVDKFFIVMSVVLIINCFENEYRFGQSEVSGGDKMGVGIT